MRSWDDFSRIRFKMLFVTVQEIGMVVLSSEYMGIRSVSIGSFFSLLTSFPVLLFPAPL